MYDCYRPLSETFRCTLGSSKEALRFLETFCSFCPSGEKQRAKFTRWNRALEAIQRSWRGRALVCLATLFCFALAQINGPRHRALRKRVRVRDCHMTFKMPRNSTKVPRPLSPCEGWGLGTRLPKTVGVPHARDLEVSLHVVSFPETLPCSARKRVWYKGRNSWLCWVSVFGKRVTQSDCWV